MSRIRRRFAMRPAVEDANVGLCCCSELKLTNLALFDGLRIGLGGNEDAGDVGSDKSAGLARLLLLLLPPRM